MISRVMTLLDSNVQFSTTTTKITRHTKKQESLANSKEKNKPT